MVKRIFKLKVLYIIKKNNRYIVGKMLHVPAIKSFSIFKGSKKSLLQIAVCL